MKSVVASAILGASLIFSAALISENIDFRRNNTINVEGGHVNFGDIYSESALIDIELKFTDSNSTAFKITGVPYTTYLKEIDKKFQGMLDDYNNDKPDEKKLTMDNMTFTVPCTLTIKAYTVYKTENIPVYELTIDKDEILYAKDASIYKLVTTSVIAFVSRNTQAYLSTMILQNNE